MDCAAPTSSLSFDSVMANAFSPNWISYVTKEKMGQHEDQDTVSSPGNPFHCIQKLWDVPVNRTHRRISGRQHSRCKDLRRPPQHKSWLRIERTLRQKPSSHPALSTIPAESVHRYKQPAIPEIPATARGIDSTGTRPEVLNFPNITVVSQEDSGMLITHRHKSPFIGNAPLAVRQTLECHNPIPGEHSSLFLTNIALHGSDRILNQALISRLQIVVYETHFSRPSGERQKCVRFPLDGDLRD
jgi:hypothetical protein